jgi:hypothetical protein
MGKPKEKLHIRTVAPSKGGIYVSLCIGEQPPAVHTRRHGSRDPHRYLIPQWNEVPGNRGADVEATAAGL